MTEPFIAPMPILPLTYQCQWIIDASDPTTGAPVTGVTITDPTIYGYNLGAGSGFTPAQLDAFLVPQAGSGGTGSGG